MSPEFTEILKVSRDMLIPVFGLLMWLIKRHASSIDKKIDRLFSLVDNMREKQDKIKESLDRVQGKIDVMWGEAKYTPKMREDINKAFIEIRDIKQKQKEA